MYYNFKVKEAVWVGTALMSYAKYLRSKNASEEISKGAFWFKQNEIRAFSQSLTKNDIQSARISQWFNGDHEDNKYNYLKSNGELRRLTATGEFSGVRERPEDLDGNLVLDLICLDERIIITLHDLRKWVNEIYSPIVLNGKPEILNFQKRKREYGNRHRNVSVSQNYNIDELITKINNFYSEIKNNENARYKSWEHCYTYFQKNIESEDSLDIMALHLAFYLASWGMYRGSSFLLQKDYKIHIPVIEILIEKKYKPLCAVSAENLLQSDIQN